VFHIGWFYGFQVQSWNKTFSGDGGTEWMTTELFVEAARALERAKFDCMVMEDALFVQDIYRGTAEFTLKHAFMSPKHDPMPYVPAMADATSHLGFIPTVTTSFYPPFLAARLLSTLDHVTKGRIGANLVMSHNDRTAQNFGLDGQVEHDKRYAMGSEWVELVTRLWESWDADAVVLDEERDEFADFTKVRTVDFEGEFYRSRGPLNTAPSPQRRPVICQAGGSPRGRDFAAEHADILLSNVNGIDGMRAYREDIRSRMVKFGRNPDDCKIVFLVAPVIGATEAEAQARWQRMKDAKDSNLEYNLAAMSYFSGVDHSTIELDEVLPALQTRGAGSTAQHTRDQSEGMTLREYASEPARSCVELIGTPDSIAAQMGEVIDAVGGDGFLLDLPLTRRNLAEVTEGLVPALQRRGLMRTEYTHAHLRDTLLEF
jgi:FMN-dependent oxidoreductase (nitrilotriacetate monooxygenase family)